MKWWFLFLLIFISTLHRGGISIQAHLLWIIGLTPLFVFTWKDRVPEGGKIQWRYDKRILTVVCGIALLTLLSFTGSQAQSLGFFSVTGVVAGIMTYLIVSQWNDEKMLRKFFQGLIITTCGLVIFGIALYSTTPPDRLFSTFAQLPQLLSNYPNAFALFLLMVTPLVFVEIHESKKWWWIAAGTLILSGIILTFSRGAWLTLGLEAIACMVIFRKNLKNLPWKRIGIVIAGTIILVAAVQEIRSQSFEINTIQKKIVFKSQEGGTSLDDRFSFWKGSLKIIEENPILGSGPDTFGVVYPKYQEKLLAHSDHPHNMFLKIAAETGIPNALLMLVLLALTFQAVIKDKGKKKYQIVLAVALGGAIFHNLIDYNFNFASTHILFWSFLGIIEGQKTQKTQEISWKIMGTVVAILALLAIYEGIQRIKIAQGRNAVAQKNQQEALTYFENANPIFRQDLDIMIGEAGGDIEKAIEKNPARSDIKNIFAEKLAVKGMTKEALMIENKVIEQDPKNWLRYYYNQERFRRTLMIPSDRKAIEKILHEYFKLLRNNTHNTINTDNPSYAIKLANLIEDWDFAKRIKFFANIERKKFQKIYNVKLAPL